MAVRLLGPVELVVDGEPVPLRRLQVRQLLAVLAAGPAASRTVDELIDDLWPGALPANPRRALQVAISRLRTALGDHGDALHGTPTSYALAVDVIDVDEFRTHVEAAVTAADTAERRRAAGRALACWRGRPFADAEGPRSLASVAEELHERRLAAVLALIESMIDDGDTTQAVIVGREWLEVSPHNERLGELVARALAFDGRKSEALQVVERTRAVLREQLGLDVSAALRQVETDILMGSVELAPSIGRSTEPPSTIIVGRGRLVASLVASLDAGTSVLLRGDAGIGKTSVLRSTSRDLTRLGRRPLVVEVAENPVRPMTPIGEIVDAILDGGGAAPTGITAAALHRVSSNVPSPPTGLAISRADFVDETARFIADGLSRQRRVLFVDDVHRLDAMSWAVLEEVVGLARSGILLCGRATVDPNLQRLFDGGTPAKVIDVPPISLEDVHEYVHQRYLRAPSPSRIGHIHRQSGGNPLFVRLLVDLDLEGALRPDRLPTSILIAVQERFDHLAAGTVAALQVAATVGIRFDLALLRRMRPDADAELQPAIDAGLVDRTDDHAEFIHGLVRDAAYQMIPPTRRVDLHDRIGALLLADGVAAPEYVDHLVAASPLDPVRAARACLDAGAWFERELAVDVAERLFTTGSGIMSHHQLQSTPLAIELTTSLGRLLRMRGDPSHVDVLLEAIDRARDGGRPELQARAVIELAHHGATTKAGVADVRAMELVEETLALELDPAVHAELCASASALTALSGSYRAGQELYRSALAAVAELDDADVEARVLAEAHLGLSDPDDFDERERVAQRLRRLAGNDVELQWEATFLEFWQRFVLADVDRARAHLIELRRLTPRTSERRRHVSMAHLDAAFSHAVGDLVAAEDSLQLAFEMASQIFDESWAQAHYGSLLFAIRHAQGRAAELADDIDRYIADHPEFPNWRAGAALIAVESGDRDRAAAHLACLSVDGFAPMVRDLTWTGCMSALATVASELAEPAAGARLYDLLVPYQRRLAWLGTCTFGAVDDALAQLADLLGDEEGAARHRVQAGRVMAPFRPTPTTA